MEDGWFRCKECQSVRRQRTPDQRYCDKEGCQRVRKNAWRRAKYGSDADYRDNQRDSSHRWLEAQGGAAAYYRRYRKRRREKSAREAKSAPQLCKQVPTPPGTNPTHESKAACAEPRSSAKSNAKVTRPSRANSDAFPPQLPVISGRYRLIPDGGANSDAISVFLSVISGKYDQTQISTR
jgi:hypothetical protein